VRIKVIVSVIISAIAYVLDHRVYLIIINMLVPLILIKDLIESRDLVRLFVNDGEPVSHAKVDLPGISIDGRRIVGFTVTSTPITADQSFEEALVRARALVGLLARFRAIAILTPGSYIIGIDESSQNDLVPELTRLGLVIRRISGFELANAMRVRIKSRPIAKPLILLLLVPPLLMASAYILAVFPMFYLAYSLMDLPRKRLVVNMRFNYEVAQDTRVTRFVDNTMLKAETLSMVSRISQANAHVVIVVWTNNDVQEEIKSKASGAYGRFLMFRHIKYFLRYKDLENTVRRIQRGEEAYSIYLASTVNFDSSFKWRWVPSPSITKILTANNGKAWSMELDLAVFTPFFLSIAEESGGLAILGRSVDNRDIYWSFRGASPHILITGPTGSGKTTLAMSIAYQVKRRLGDKVRVVIIDPHGHTKVLMNLMRIGYVDLGTVKVMSRDVSIVVEAIRMMNPLLSIGPEGALLRMVLANRNDMDGIGDIVRSLDELSNDIVLREAYYNLYNSLALLINYYNHGASTVSVDDLLNGDIIFTMNSITNEELSRYLATLILLTMFKKAVSECGSPPCPLRYIVLIDEAHNILGIPSEYRLLGVNNVINRMVREVRKFGIALVMLLQPPLDMLDPGILENLGTIVMLSGGHQYVSHLLNVISSIDGDDASWLLSGQYRALVMRHGARPIRLVRLYVPKGLLKDYVIKEK